MTSLLRTHAARLAVQYESLAFEDVIAGLLDLRPPPGKTMLDVGAGPGRDAAWFAARDYDVVAIDPSEAMLGQAQERYFSQNIHYCPAACQICTAQRPNQFSVCCHKVLTK